VLKIKLFKYLKEEGKNLIIQVVVIAALYYFFYGRDLKYAILAGVVGTFNVQIGLYFFHRIFRRF
jgi:hypothetical protein